MPAPITYEHIFQCTSNGVVVTDAAGIIVHINRQGEKILGFSAAKHTGVFISDILPLTGPQVMSCLKSRRAKLGHHIIGKQVDLVLNITLVEEQGVILGAICNFQEMRAFEATAKKLESYKQLNKQLETIVKASFDGIWVCDGRGKVISINDASERLNGIKAADVIGKNVKELVGEGLFDRSVTLEVLETKRQVSIMQHIGKTDRFLLATGTPAFDEEGNIYLVVINERDMTDLNAMSQELEQSYQVTEKFKDELAELSMLELKGDQVVAESDEMRKILSVALKLARIGASNILLLGESGTGKGLLAKFIHQSSERRKSPFIQINCAALPENLLEAELFGYEKGAFTGAAQQGKAGLFELAHGGTLFLDEIGDMPLQLQGKLLKCLDDHEIQRLGATRSRKIDCLIIAATNQDLETQVKKKRFRPDLYYRLNAFSIKLPPLRERRDDIFELTDHFLKKYNQAYGMKKRIHAEGFNLLQNYSFQGNIRELKNIIKRAVVMSENPVLDDFLRPCLKNDAPVEAGNGRRTPGSRSLHDELMSFEREIIRSAMLDCSSTRALAARLHTSQATIVRKMKKYGLSF